MQTGGLFRCSPFVELKPLSSLAPAQRESFRELEADPEVYGLFVAKPPSMMTVKSVARETAELFQSLASPARIDGALLEDVVDLVLDGILEIESGDGFVSGADALPFVGVPVAEGGAGLSRDALLHAQELESNDPQALAKALYYYNHIPISAFWKKRFAGPEAVLSHIGADRGALRTILDRGWSQSVYENHWLSWIPRQRDNEPAPYKLYVSPRPERIREAFEAFVRVLTAFPVTFKMGCRAAGLLRPDKLVAYFATREELDEAASMMRRELAGCDAHGVPFTAALEATGLLSWGVDPPESERVVRWLQRQSWRLWVVQRLGSAMATARAARTASAVEPWRFAVARIQRLGVDVDTWTPSATLWSSS